MLVRLNHVASFIIGNSSLTTSAKPVADLNGNET